MKSKQDLYSLGLRGGMTKYLYRSSSNKFHTKFVESIKLDTDKKYKLINLLFRGPTFTEVSEVYFVNPHVNDCIFVDETR